MPLLRREDVEARDAPAAEAEPGGLLGKGSRFEGKLDFDGTVRIDGMFKGDISSEGRLVVGASASIEGQIDVGTAIVSGKVVGGIRARSLLELKASARVHGTIAAGALVVERGAHFDGAVEMLRDGATVVGGR